MPPDLIGELLRLAVYGLGWATLILFGVVPFLRETYRILRDLASPQVTPPAPAPPSPSPIRVDLEGQLVLDGRRLHDGEPVAVLLPAGEWLAGELRREPEGWPALWVVLGGPWEHSTNGRRSRRPCLAARVSPDALMRRL